MRSELFRIPVEWAGVPIFGVGVLLAVWFLGGGFGIVVLSRKNGSSTEMLGYLPSFLIGAAAIALLPRLFPEGLPIRGYGVMVLLGSVAGLGLAAHRARQVKLNPEIIFSLAFGMFLFGILGARLFYVIEYWPSRFQFETWSETLLAAVKFTEGGLVVYGALLGATLAFGGFAWRHRLPPLALADLIAPSLLVGLALGRIGCLLNGCCYGGETTVPWAVTFPQESLAYQDQAFSGRWHELSRSDIPLRSRPVHPTQVYSAVHAALLAWVLWSFFPFRRRDGEVTALMLTVYPISRFLLEMIRVDESAVFGTGLSISQNLSLVLLVGTMGLWVFLFRQPKRLAGLGSPNG